MAFFMGRAAGQGQLLHIALVFAVMVGPPLLLSLGKNYWYLIPASLLSGLPAIPLGGRNIDLGELCIAICFPIFITRVAFKLDKLILWRPTHVPIYLFASWVFFIFCLYPIGLAVFGASTMGARFYAQVLLALMAFLIIASRDITERDCKWIIIFILLGSLFNAIYSIGSFFLFGPGDQILNPTSDSDGFYTWHQSLSGPAMAGVFLLFAWKTPRDILGFQNPLLLFAYLFAIALTLYSGKRMALIAIFLAPMVSAIVNRQFFYIFMGIFLSGFFFLTVAFGHGDVFKFPLQVQRTLSWLPAKWDPEFQNMVGGRDDFRASLRRFALQNIERNPIIGKGFAIEYSEIIGQISSGRLIGGEDMLAAPYAIGRAWHNTWLGYAADFGIPLSVIQGILYLTILFVAFRTSRAYARGTGQSILAIYILIFCFRDFLATHTSGHSASDAYNRWWMYGLLFSLYAASKIPSTVKPKAQSSRELILDRMSQSKPSPASARS